MKKFFNSNLFIGILSVVMAIFLLFYVASIEDPVQEKPISNVNVAVTGLPEEYVLEAPPGQVEIRVSGTRSSVNLASTNNVRAYVDMSNAHPGKAGYVIHYTLPAGVSIVSIRPDYVELNVDVWDSRELVISVRTNNTVQQGYSSLAPVVSPNVVTVSGPRRVLGQIGKAEVGLDLTGRTADYSGYLPVVLLDGDGQIFENNDINLSDEEVSVHVGVLENLLSKSVSVRTPISGNVNGKYTVVGMEVQPSTVKITGSYAVVSQIEYLNTEAIDLTPMTETHHGVVRLLTPPDVEVLEGETVEVTIQIEKNLVQKTIERVPVEIRNTNPDMVYETVPKTVDVTLDAFPDDFDAAMENGVLSIGMAVYIDMDDHPQEGLDYPVYVDVPERFSVIQLSSDTVRVAVSNEE